MSTDLKLRKKRDEAWFDRWCRRISTRPVCKVSDREMDVLIADSGEPVRQKGRFFYRTAYCIVRPGAGAHITNHHDYDPVDFLFDSKRGGQEKRVNEALTHARLTLDSLKEGENYFFDGDPRRIRQH